MSSSSSTSRRRYNFGDSIHSHECQCGNQVVLRMSWTDRNPGRRFWQCSEFGQGGNGCGFFDWADPPMCSRAISIIPELLKRINRDKEEIEKLKAMLEVATKTNVVLSMKYKCCKFAIVIIFAIGFVVHVFSKCSSQSIAVVKMLLGN
ncbi:PREDICTED: uncharacterized protein LOC109156721 [Ipomoea nil]|uniref:uncharacterized protein LOC109156721 n=1 Tax=Ipomoea nil TaxID=35883 RepID=UPI0009010A0A|nr:PREDICTED: uncharacterized protein LOC109156721 [Ipomoea nil]